MFLAKIAVGLFLTWLLWMFFKSITADMKRSKKVEAKKAELQEVRNEHKVLDMEEQLNEAKAKLQRRKDSRS